MNILCLFILFYFKRYFEIFCIGESRCVHLIEVTLHHYVLILDSHQLTFTFYFKINILLFNQRMWIITDYYLPVCVYNNKGTLIIKFDSRAKLDIGGWLLDELFHF